MMDLMSLLFLISLMATCQGSVPFDALHSTVVLRDAREIGPSTMRKQAGDPRAWQAIDDGAGRTMALRIPTEGA